MKTSDTIDKLAAALVKAQGEFKDAIKDATNPAFKSKYADLASVWAAIRKTLLDNSLAVIQLPVHADDERVHLTTRIFHASGQWLEETASIPLTKRDAHGYGSAITYLRRYMVKAGLGIADADDDGNAAVEPERTPDTAKQVAVDAFDLLDDEVKKYLQLEAVRIIAMHERGEEIGAYVTRQDYDTEAKLGLWSLLPSNVRSAIKKQSRAAEAAAVGH